MISEIGYVLSISIKWAEQNTPAMTNLVLLVVSALIIGLVIEKFTEKKEEG